MTDWKNRNKIQDLIRKQLSKEQALQKLKHYCGYQERSHSEVKEKLYSLGVWKKDHDEIMAALIEENYLNEERFAMSFARGKFRMKQWGRVEIKYELKQRQVSEYSIKKALKQIEDQPYAVELKNHHHITNILKIGIAFSGKSVLSEFESIDLFYPKNTEALLTIDG